MTPDNIELYPKPGEWAGSLQWPRPQSRQPKATRRRFPLSRKGRLAPPRPKASQGRAVWLHRGQDGRWDLWPLAAEVVMPIGWEPRPYNLWAVGDWIRDGTLPSDATLTLAAWDDNIAIVSLPPAPARLSAKLKAHFNLT